MNEQQFLGLWKNIHAIFGMDGMGSNRLEAFNSCLERVSHIAPEAGDFILERFRDFDRLPLNMGKAVQDAYDLWRSRQKRNRQPTENLFKRKGCERCIDGYIYASRTSGGGYEYVYPFGCGHCGQGNDSFPEMTREQLSRAGYVIRMPLESPEVCEIETSCREY